MSSLRAIQYHAVVFAPDANGGPGLPKFELTPEMLNVVWQQGLNFPGQAAISLYRWGTKLADIDWMLDHIKLYRETAAGTKVVFAGKLIKPSYSARDVVATCWDYAAFLQRSRTGFRVMYPEATIDSIVSAEWNLAKTVDKSPFAFVTTGTIQQPLGLDGVTAIKTNREFGVVDFDRLFLFYAMAELSMANTSNTVVYEITRETPHTFNFWKNRSTQRTAFAFTSPGNVIDVAYDTGHDQLVNDLATVILDPTTGQQVEYSLTNNPSKDTYRRLQSAVTIKTLFGLNSGATETDQQKAALARMLTVAAAIPALVVVFPRQGEFDPFVGCDLGDTFRVTIMNPERTGDERDGYMKWSGVAGAWAPDAGELLQVFMR